MPEFHLSTSLNNSLNNSLDISNSKSLSIQKILGQLEIDIVSKNRDSKEIFDELSNLEKYLKKSNDSRKKSWLEHIQILRRDLEIHNDDVNIPLPVNKKKQLINHNFDPERSNDITQKFTMKQSQLILQEILPEELDKQINLEEEMEDEKFLKLKSGLSDLKEINTQLLDEVLIQEQKLNTVSNNLQETTSKTDSGIIDQKKALIGATIGLMALGGVVGGVVGGPVGAVVGYQVSALAAGAGVGIGMGIIGGGVAGIGIGKARAAFSGVYTKLRKEKKKEQSEESEEDHKE